MNKINYQKQLDKLLLGLADEVSRPRLLLHSCCAPCSSYVLEYLSQYFQITVLYYNPNIYPDTEYYTRVDEQQELIHKMEVTNPVELLKRDYNPDEFYNTVKGLENIPEGGERCFSCYELRLREAAIAAKEGGFDYFTTTLTISPLKNAEKLNEIGKRMEQEYGVKYLTSDFKKKNGYKRSIELSEKYGLYRQEYCGCIFSRNERIGKE